MLLTYIYIYNVVLNSFYFIHTIYVLPYFQLSYIYLPLKNPTTINTIATDNFKYFPRLLIDLGILINKGDYFDVHFLRRTHNFITVIIIIPAEIADIPPSATVRGEDTNNSLEKPVAIAKPTNILMPRPTQPGRVRLFSSSSPSLTWSC